MEPIFLLRDAGEGVSDRPRRTVRILADVDAVVVTESRYVPGEKGPDSHIHHRHTDAFFVLDGALVFEVGHERKHVRAAAGSFAAVPATVVHTFWNDGPEDAWFLNMHAPGENFAEHLRAARDGRPDPGFDTDDPPPDGGPPAAEVVFRKGGEGETLALGPVQTTFKLEKADRGGTFSLNETVLQPGAQGPLPHRHERFADSFYVLEGTLTLRLDDRIVAAPPRTFALAPPGTVHGFSNVDAEPVRFLNLMAPGGFEAYLREVLERAGDRPPTPELMTEVAARHDFRRAD